MYYYLFIFHIHMELVVEELRMALVVVAHHSRMVVVVVVEVVVVVDTEPELVQPS